MLALALLVLGAVAHVAHHAMDPSCDDGRGHSSHPCVSCSVLHGAALAAQAIAIAPATPAHVHDLRLPEISVAIATVLPTGAPRAPPLA
jgi:hypothetical protein